MDDKTVQGIANSINSTPDRVREVALEALETNREVWASAGKDESSMEIQALRVAQIKISRANASLSRSGAENYVGMFVSVPRVKKWGEIRYNKMKNEMRTHSPEVINTLIRDAKIVTFEQSGDSFIRKANPALFRGEAPTDEMDETTVTELPQGAMQYDANNWFYLVWETNPKWPSGDSNFRFGKPLPLDNRERKVLFLGKKEGEQGEPRLLTIRANGKEADALYPPTFITGRIPLKPARNGDVAYAVRGGVSTFVADASLQSLFQNPPFMLDNGQPKGAIVDVAEAVTNVGGLETYHQQQVGSDGWYDKMVACAGEVIHMEPRDNGAIVLILGDEDLSSVATIDIWVSAKHASSVNFGVSSKVVALGQTWEGREGDIRFTCTGWYAYDVIEAAPTDFVSDDSDNSFENFEPEW